MSRRDILVRKLPVGLPHDESPESFIKRILDLKKELGAGEWIVLDTDYYYDSCNIEAHVYRKQTDEEYEKVKKKTEKAKKTREERERNEYERLKQKYDKSDTL